MERSKIAETIDMLNDISNQMYKGDVLNGVASMATVIPSLAEIAGCLDDCKQECFVNEALKPALEAMEERDGTMLADILTYEMIPVLEELL
ncbi:MAG: hypothetical protein IJX85_05380 [Lachnospiraceae bacterium]|nr:hypothetical protein [Lachnospiraceae bacterium]